MDPQPIVINESDIFSTTDLENEGIFIEHEPEVDESSSGDLATTSIKKELLDSGGVEVLRGDTFVNIEDDFGPIIEGF